MKFRESHELAQYLLSQPNQPIYTWAVEEYSEDGWTCAIDVNHTIIYDNEELINPKDSLILGAAKE